MIDNLTIRKCVPGDEAALSLVGQASFLEAFAGTLDGRDILAHCGRQHSEDVYRTWLADPAVDIWVAESKDAPVGYVVLAPSSLPVADPRPGDIEIKRVYLLHRFQGTGLGKALMETASSHARATGKTRILLGVYSGNTGAIAFYRKLGYVDVGTREFTVGNHTYHDLILALPA